MGVKLHEIGCSLLLLLLILMPAGCSSGTAEPESLEELRSLPYLSFTGDTDTEKKGVVFYNKDKAQDGFNLYDGLLMDMEGNVVHSFANRHLGIIQDDGTYLGQRFFQSSIFGKYDWNSGVLWEHEDFFVHHVIESDENNIYTLTKEVVEYNGRLVEFDVILMLSQNGDILMRWSLWDNLDEISKYHSMLELDKPAEFEIPQEHRMNSSVWGGDYDYYHMNSFQLIPDNKLSSYHSAFRQGNWLVSFRHGSLIMIIDKDTGKVGWYYGPGNIEGQHSPTMLESGNILIFDNGRYRNYSRVIELDPVALKIVWEYRDDGFFTLSRGYAQRLPNGNTLITESDEGHVFEVTPGKDIVWEFYHPAFGKDGKRQSIYTTRRYSKEFIEVFMSSGVYS